MTVGMFYNYMMVTNGRLGFESGGLMLVRAVWGGKVTRANWLKLKRVENG